MSTKTAQKTFARHLAKIKSGVADRTTVIGLRKTFNARARLDAGWSIGGTAPHMSQDEIHQLWDAIEQGRPLVCGELRESGLALLKIKRYAKRLAPYQEIIDAITCFRLVGYSVIGSAGVYPVPIYMAVSPVGSFVFRNIPWQNGGKGPEIKGRDF